MRARLALLVLVATLLIGAPAPARADHDTSTSIPVVEAPSIIPKPNTGVAPTDAGDRGGWLQVTVFLAIVTGVGVIAAVIVRQSRSARAERQRL